MTPEQRSAVERVRRVRNGEEAYAVYGQHVDAHALHWRDLGQVADAYLAEHLPDDDEPVTLEDLRLARFAAVWFGVDLFVEDFCAGKWAVVRTSGAFAVKTRVQLRDLLKGLGR